VSAPSRRREKLLSRGLQLGFLVGLLLLWYLATARWGVSHILLPAPAAVWRELGDVLGSGEFLPDLRVTLIELASAFAIACTFGLACGYLISRSRYATAVFEPLLASIYSVPMILLLPLYVLFFGLGSGSKIALGATVSFFPIVLSTIAGFGSVERIFVTSARSMGASNAQMFRYVLFPAALPVIVTGLRMGFTIALLAILGSETIASFAGLGHKIAQLAEAMETARMFAYIAFAVAIVAILNIITTALERRAKQQ
jgi:ABC-type nitrate/sulfonate/bicarbonate transport system permease component